MNDYLANANLEMFTAYGFTTQLYQPWQLGIFSEEKGKFVWYPRSGTLMKESEYGNKKLGEFFDTEKVCEIISKYPSL